MRVLPLLAAISLSTGLATSLSSPALADTVRLQENAPDKHVVVKGDTLWDISEKFLKDPWKWPEVWQLNRAEIKNPHLIYPGDVVLLTMENGKPRLSLQKSRFGETVKLSPQARSEPIVIKDGGIPAVDPKTIAPFLGLGVVVNQAALEKAPKLIGAVDERVLIMVGDSVYATPGEGETKDWQIFRAGKELIDPDTKEVLAYEAQGVGNARTTVAGNPQTVLIKRAQAEIVIGDRMLPDNPIELETLVPHAPAKDVTGKIIAAYGGGRATSQYATVVVNKGVRDGLEPGHVLAIHRQGRELKKDDDVERSLYADGQTAAWRYMDVACLKPGAKASATEAVNAKDIYKLDCRPGDISVRLPDHKVGVMFLFRVYDKVAYGLIMRADGPVYLMDTVKNP